MILADKIMNLRKKNGWSQEELAEKLGVSRQSISKYEGAQAVPDLDKILKLSQIFGVTTDYLIKDEIEIEEYDTNVTESEEDSTCRKVTMEMANEFLTLQKAAAVKKSFATLLCILSPITLLFMAAASEVPAYGLSENVAGGIGLCVLIIIITVAVAIFVMTGMKEKKYEFLQTEDFETEYGVTGMVKERKERFQGTYARWNVMGTIFCIASVIPLFLGMAMFEQDICIVAMLCMTLCIVGVGVFFFVLAGTNMGALDRLLEEGDFTKKNKKVNRSTAVFNTVYWSGATAFYLAYSFITEDWRKSWIVWPVAGVLYPVFRLIVVSVKRSQQDER